jgi:hypothetical protein
MKDWMRRYPRDRQGRLLPGHPQYKGKIPMKKCHACGQKLSTVTIGDKVQHRYTRHLAVVQRPLRIGEELIPVILITGDCAGRVAAWYPHNTEKVVGNFLVTSREAL